MQRFIEFTNSDGNRVKLKVMGTREAIEINMLKFAQSWNSDDTRLIKIGKDKEVINETIIIRA